MPLKIHNKLAALVLASIGAILSSQANAAGLSEPPRWAEVALGDGRFSKAPPAQWVQPVQVPEKGFAAPLSARILDTQTRLGGDGEQERYTRMILEGADGALFKQTCRQPLPLNPQYEKLTLHTLALWRDGKKLDQLQNVQPRFLTADGASTTIYGGQVITLLEVSDCRPGDQLELAWTVSGSNPVFGKQGYSVQQAAQMYPVAQRTVAFTYPLRSEWHVDVVPQVDSTQARWPGKLLRKDSQTNGWQQVTFIDHMVPAATPKFNAATGSPQFDLVTASAFKDWGEVSRWAQALFIQPAAPVSDAYKALLADVIKQPTDAERAAFALHWVQREIRYVSVSLGENSHRPSAPDEVLARRYGDCKDVTLLLTHVLRDAGVDVQPALYNSRDPKFPPMLHAVPLFDHAIAVAWVNGRAYALDGTSPEETARLEHMTTWYALAPLLVVGGKNAGFLTIPQPDDIEGRTVLRDERLRVEEDGRLGILTVRVVLRGAAADMQRKVMRRIPREQVKEALLQQLRKTYPNADWNGEPAYQDDEPHNRIEMTGVFRVPEPLKRRSGGGLRHVYSKEDVTSLLNLETDANRRVPIGLRTDPQRMVFTHTLELPIGWLIEEEPSSDGVDVPAFEMRTQRTRPAANQWVERTELTIRKDTVLVSEMAAYQAASQRVFDLETSVRVRH